MPDKTSHKKFSEGKQAHVIATELTSVGLAHTRKSTDSGASPLKLL